MRRAGESGGEPGEPLEEEEEGAEPIGSPGRGLPYAASERGSSGRRLDPHLRGRKRRRKEPAVQSCG